MKQPDDISGASKMMFVLLALLGLALTFAVVKDILRDWLWLAKL